MFGIASADAASGAPVVLAVEGVCELAKVSTDAFTVGERVYWDADLGICTDASNLASRKPDAARTRSWRSAAIET